MSHLGTACAVVFACLLMTTVYAAMQPPAANPRLASRWVDLGLDAERQGRLDQARDDLLQAAGLDKRYLPAWTLANFYLRLGDAENFWPWARRAALLNYDDLRPLLQLAHAMEPDAPPAVQRLGGGERLLRADLDYLIEQSRFDQAQQVARLLLARGSPQDRPRLIETAGRQIRAGNARYALELWNALFSPLDPERGVVLANGDLEHAPSGLAFDGRLPPAEGVSAKWQPSRLSFSLDGSQPESCALLEQVVPLAPARRYRLSFEYLTGVSEGVFWDLDGKESAALKPAETWQQAQSLFRAHASLGQLRLIYRREAGTVRSEGRLEIRNLHMEAL